MTLQHLSNTRKSATATPAITISNLGQALGKDTVNVAPEVTFVSFKEKVYYYIPADGATSTDIAKAIGAAKDEDPNLFAQKVSATLSSLWKQRLVYRRQTSSGRLKYYHKASATPTFTPARYSRETKKQEQKLFSQRPLDQVAAPTPVVTKPAAKTATKLVGIHVRGQVYDKAEALEIYKGLKEIFN